jgi:hypothetical protein
MQFQPAHVTAARILLGLSPEAFAKGACLSTKELASVEAGTAGQASVNIACGFMIGRGFALVVDTEEPSVTFSHRRVAVLRPWPRPVG